MSATTYLDALRRAMLEEMDRDPAVCVLGQDIAAFGGAFRATRGLYERFGRLRVVNTPLCESGALGAALGAALAGMRPVVELQFADFISCGFNQVVNNLAKTYYRWEAPVPVVLRLPYGGGVGAGPFHSQSPEAWFAHTPGLCVVAPATPRDALGMLKASIRDPNPVVFLEHRFLYRREKEELPDGEELLTPLGRARVARPGDHVTALSWGWTLHECVAAAEELARDGVSVEVIDLRTLVPLDEDAVFSAVRRTGKVLVVHEATATAGFGAELVARIADHCFEDLDGPLRRVTYPDRASPYAKSLEQSLLPGRARIAQELRRLARY
ncbi:MAG: alpha-ketoacid dehydrogenase subunit beta [Deltaproteobacteria bacterium]|nr:alpha-ketoacid dehydrogenase subunit beta [Deltaproteobacteria bacterium]